MKTQKLSLYLEHDIFKVWFEYEYEPSVYCTDSGNPGYPSSHDVKIKEVYVVDENSKEHRIKEDRLTLTERDEILKKCFDLGMQSIEY